MKEGEIVKKIPLETADAVILKVPFEGTVSGSGGAAAGPDAIAGMLKYQVELYDHLLKETICDKVKIIEKNISVRQLNSQQLVEKIKEEALDLLKRDKFVVTLGGEHTVSLGPIAAHQKFFKDITVLQIDAHADMRYDNSDYEDNPKKITKYAHSAVMRRAYELGCQLVQVGIRSMSPMENNFLRKERLQKNIFFAPVKASYREIISRCRHKKVYLTIDVDGFDSSAFPATGTPEPGGLSWDWGMEFFKELFAQKEIIGFDIVEVAPRKGDNITEFSAAKLFYHLIGLKYLSK
jgi:agmatinase